VNFAFAVLSELTWRKLAVMLALGFSIPLIAALVGVRALSVMMALMLVSSAIANLLVALSADEAVKRGTALRFVYPVAILVLLIVHCAIAESARRYFGEALNPPNVRSGMVWLGVLRFGLDQSLWGVFALFVYLNRRIAQRMLQRVHATELRRVQLEAQLVESRLAAAQAQVDPQMLFGALADIREKLSTAAPEADERLDDLIQRLRSALAHTNSNGEPEARSL
jgi:sensor histidine kinase YesM